MPTQILRPDATISQTGMNVSPNIHAVLNDDDDNTTSNQIQEIANYTVSFDDTSGLGSATIEKFVFSFRGVQDRRPGQTVTVTITDGAGQPYSNFTLGGSGFTSTITTYNSSDFTTQRDGTTALNASYIDGLRVLITPSGGGHRVIEEFITVTYAASGYSNTVAGVSSIDQVVGVAAANISQVAGV
jgi:hypothetical protein